MRIHCWLNPRSGHEWFLFQRDGIGVDRKIDITVASQKLRRLGRRQRRYDQGNLADRRRPGLALPPVCPKGLNNCRFAGEGHTVRHLAKRVRWKARPELSFPIAGGARR